MNYEGSDVAVIAARAVMRNKGAPSVDGMTVVRTR